MANLYTSWNCRLIEAEDKRLNTVTYGGDLTDEQSYDLRARVAIKSTVKQESSLPKSYRFR